MSVICGDSLHVLPTFDAESVDAIVCDPPYGLSFMGKDWDHGVPGEAFWREAWRVAKPGAHLVAFGGTRTFHRLTCAIEDAGWEIRDCLSWLYGSGFPKSHDVSKAIDKMDAAEEQSARRLRFTAWVRSTGVTPQQVSAATGTEMGHHYTTHLTQPAIMTREHLEACRHLLGDVPEWVERECDIRSVESRNFAEREVVGSKAAGMGSGKTFGMLQAEGENAKAAKTIAITAPATDLAREWQGWGTALKPAWEPIILARKPLVGTVAANVTQYGTGALNVDGCRIGTGEDRTSGGISVAKLNAIPRGTVTGEGLTGRWPANVCLDEEAAALFPESRFFYTAKVSRREREAGLESVTVDSFHRYGAGIGEGKDPDAPALNRNHHPTVKPIAVMRWLCRLVTPKGGLILDSFTGSGTTGCAAVLEGFRFVGVEREPEYAAIAEKRIAHWSAQTPDADLFTEAQ